ncbi:MAG: PKD domain-containing protein, partial [Bdellovibrionales bacterium]|nr:PKD domain-containing protein [Bdellovibrionales bacterium]
MYPLFTRVHAGHVWINNHLILTPGSLNITTQEVRIPIDLSEDTSTLSLKLKGFPGSFIKVSVYGEGSNQPPILNLTWSTDEPLEDEVVLFDAIASTDDDGFITEVHFDWGDNTSSTGFVAEHSWQVAGVYVVTVTVTDDDGAQTSVSIEFTVLPKPKPPSDGGGIFYVTKSDGLPVRTQLSTIAPIVDEDSEIVCYTWDFGTGKTLTLYPHETDSYASVDHFYQAGGSYAVSLTILDSTGLSTTTSKTIEIFDNQRPVAQITADRVSGPAPLTVQFDASQTLDEEGDPIRHRWRFGDNSPEVIGIDQAVVSHTYSTPGTYTLRYRARDDKMGRAEVFLKIIVSDQVQNTPPVPVLLTTPLLGEVSHIVQFDGRSSFDLDSSGELSFEWDFGDLSDPINYSSSPSPSYIYRYPGSYFGNLVVKDAQGLSSQQPFVVHVKQSQGDGQMDYAIERLVSDSLGIWVNTGIKTNTALIDSNNYHWFFDQTQYEKGRSPNYTFAGSGPHEVRGTGFDVL